MKYKILFWLILLSGLALRLYHVWTAPYAYANCDNATIWLMAKHILNGEFPLFFYGQYYLGPMEPLTVAFFWILFGKSIYTLYFGTIFYSVLFGISAYFLGRIIQNRTIGILSMLYSVFPASFFFWESVSPLGYHIEIPFLGNLIFIYTLKICSEKKMRLKLLYYILIGAIAGTGIWTHYIMIYYLLPVALYLLFNEKWKSLLLYSITSIASLILSALPFWIFTFKYNFASFNFPPHEGVPTKLGVILKTLLHHVCDMFSIDYVYHPGYGAVKLVVFVLYALCAFWIIIPFLLSFIRRENKLMYLRSKSSILFHLFFSIILLYAIYRRRQSAGEGYNYIMPILNFVSLSFAIFGEFLLRRARYLGYCFIIFIIGFNVNTTLDLIREKKAESIINITNINTKIKFYDDNNICHFIGHDRNARVPAFYSDERIIGTDCIEPQYYPYEDKVASCDSIAFEGYPRDWISALNNVCQQYKYKNRMFFDFKPFNYKMRSIDSSNWQGHSRVNSWGMKYAFDRNIDTVWYNYINNRTCDSFIVDLQKKYTLCKIAFFGTSIHDSICIFKIQTSLDGKTWRDCLYVRNFQPLCWSGPRLYWHLVDGRNEWYFKPIEAKYLRITQIANNGKTLWDINELFLYEYEGEEIPSLNEYHADTSALLDFLKLNNVSFIYADFWLSAKIRNISNGKIDALVQFNPYLPPRKNMSRNVSLGKEKAFVVSKSDCTDLENILLEFDLPYQKKDFCYFSCYYFPNLDKMYSSIPSLYWIGIGVAKTSLRDYSRWLSSNGMELKALKYDQDNYLAFKKYKAAPKTRFIPSNGCLLKFSNGVDFLGYSVRSQNLKRGRFVRIEYFWEMGVNPIDNISVFVYFMKDGNIIFQDDHNFLFNYRRPLKLYAGDRYREATKLKLPENIEPGTYKIVIGLWDKTNNKRIAFKDMNGKKDTKAYIGEIKIY